MVSKTAKYNHFKKIIFDRYANHEAYDETRSALLNIYETMSKRHKCFNEKSVKKQFEYCETIGLIAIHSQRQQIYETEVLYKKEKKVFDHSVTRRIHQQPIEIEVVEKMIDQISQY